MDAKKVVEMLNDRDIFDLLEELGGQPIERGNTIDALTICHGGHKHKLTYYKESKSFQCWTNCGHMSIFDMVAKVIDGEFIDALRFIVKKYNLHDNDYQIGFTFEKVEDPGKKLLEKMKGVEMPTFMKLNSDILKDFYPFYHQLWINDGISIESMKKYKIKYSIENNQIIIPHFDKNGNLIGVRARNLNKKEINEGKKYMPIFHGGKVLKHMTGANLYGLYENRENIEKDKKLILFESEKSVLQLNSMLPEHSIGVCVSGSSLTQYQLELIKELNIDEVIIGVDKEFSEVGTEKEKMYAEKILRVFKRKLAPYVRVSVLWDLENDIEEKDSPTDKGKEIFLKLFKNRIYI